MKKKILIIQSVIMILVTMLMLSVASFAWFVSNNKTDLGSFDVSVVGVSDIEYKFYSKESGAYVEHIPSSATAFIADKTMIPGGEPIWRRIDITNKSKDPISVKIDFTGVVAKVNDVTNLTGTYTNLIANYVTKAGAVDYVASPGADTDTSAVAGAVDNKFLTDILGGAKTNAFTLIQVDNILVNQTKTIYYYFALNAGYTGDESVETFELVATGVQFRV